MLYEVITLLRAHRVGRDGQTFDDAVRIRFEDQAIHAVRLNPVLLPDPGHHHVMDSQLLGQAPSAPVRGAIGGLLAGVVQDPSFHPGREDRDGPSFMPGVQSREPLLQEPLLPFADEGFGAVDLLGDLPVRGSLGSYNFV